MSTLNRNNFTEQLTAQYDSWYGSTETLFSGGEPIPVIQQLLSYKTAGSVLDVGGGDGRNALYLAEQGFSVTVVDLSAVGLQKIDTLAKEKELDITTIVGDITAIELPTNQDVVIFSFVLHHLKTEEAVAVITQLQTKTPDKGLHVFATLANRGELYDRAKNKDRFYPSEEVLQRLYTGWQTLFFVQKETTVYARRKDGTRMKNDMVVALLQKT